MIRPVQYHKLRSRSCVQKYCNHEPESHTRGFSRRVRNPSRLAASLLLTALGGFADLEIHTATDWVLGLAAVVERLLGDNAIDFWTASVT